MVLRHRRTSTERESHMLTDVEDVFSNRNVGHLIAHWMTATLVVHAVIYAVTRRGNVTGCVSRADRESQFRLKAFQDTLTRHGVILPMGPVARVADNAAMVPFHALLQGRILDRQPRDARDQPRLAIPTWSETKHHRRRRLNRLDRLTPVEYEAETTAETGAPALIPRVTKMDTRPPILDSQSTSKRGSSIWKKRPLASCPGQRCDNAVALSFSCHN